MAEVKSFKLISGEEIVARVTGESGLGDGSTDVVVDRGRSELKTSVTRMFHPLLLFMGEIML